MPRDLNLEIDRQDARVGGYTASALYPPTWADQASIEG